MSSVCERNDLVRAASQHVAVRVAAMLPQRPTAPSAALAQLSAAAVLPLAGAAAVLPDSLRLLHALDMVCAPTSTSVGSQHSNPAIYP